MSYKVDIVEKKIELHSYKEVSQVLKTCLVIFYMKQEVLRT